MEELTMAREEQVVMSADMVLKDLNIEAPVMDEEVINIPDPVINEDSNADTVLNSQEEKEKKEAKKIIKDIESNKSKQSNVDYETTVTLPSKGLLYNGEVPSDITLRGMTTRDEKILYTSQGGNVFQKLLRSCITDPVGLDTSKLIATDEYFLILQLRMVTYGPEYNVEMECPHCGGRNKYTIHLNDLIINELDDDFKEPILVDLPRSKDKLAIKILRNEDIIAVEKFSKKFAKQFNLNPREVEYEARLAKYITEINGKKIDFESAREYVVNMPSMDTAKMRSVLSKINVGVDTTVTVECQDCGNEFSFSMPMTGEFFRPTIE